MSVMEDVARPAVTSWSDEIRAMTRLAWPLVLTNLAQTAMTVTDMAFIGRLGGDALAAAALGHNLYFAPLILGLGLVYATAPMMATELGRRPGAVRDVRRTVRQGFWLSLLAVVPIWVLLWNGEAVLLAIGQDPSLAAEAAAYLRWMQWSILPFYFYTVLRSFMSALERPLWALAVMFVAVAFNAFANWVFVFGRLGFPAMGVPGSGLATTLASTLMFLGLALVVSVEPGFRRFRLLTNFWRADWPRLRALLALGLPIAGILGFEVTIFNAAAMLMGLIDAASLAAHAIAIQIASITFMVPLGLNQAVTVRVGLANGAGSPDGVARAGWTAYGLGISFMALMALIMVIWPQTLIGGFIDVADPANRAVVRLATIFLAFAALFQIADGAQAVASGMLRGLSDTRVPMLLAAIGYWGIGLPLGVLLGFPLGYEGSGIWTGLSCGLAVVALLLLRRWLSRERLGLVRARR